MANTERVFCDSKNFDKFLDSSKTKVFADLHIHSRFSRACSKDLTIENLEKWARVKGLGLLGTGDFTHPLWLKELKEKLVEKDGIFYTGTGFKFILSGEISLMYTHGRGRRVHLVLLVPNFETVDKINSYLDEKGRRDYDGRPIFKISCEDFVAKMQAIDKRIEVIPAHCLLSDTFIHANNSIKKIKDVKEGDLVYTHNNQWKKVKEVLIRDYFDKTIKITPWYFSEGLETTPEHPYYAIKSYKNCKSTKGLCKKGCSQEKVCARKYFMGYKDEWISAKDVEVGDFLVYPRWQDEKDTSEIDLTKYLESYKEINKDTLIAEFARNHTGKINRIVKINEQFCRLIGYFLSEGYLIKDSGIGFSFNSKEKEYIQEVISSIKDCFGFEVTKIDSRRENQADLLFASRLLNQFFSHFYSNRVKRANNKSLPSEFSTLSKMKLAEILRGWWRGDTGVTVSRELSNQMKIICLKLGIIPSISIHLLEDQLKRKRFVNNREIIPKSDLVTFSNLSFFEEDYGMLKEPCFKKSINKLNRKHGFVDSNYIYLPVRKIELKEYKGKVYNLEVEDDNSYVAEFACVHNCWTPYFGVYGSKSGYDSLKEAFGSQCDNIHAIETGMSSSPEMNWHISELNEKAIVSFSDAHSFWPWRIGREATIFEKIESYQDIIDTIREKKILGTIETDPAYGIYHYDGHKDCDFSCSPQESRELQGICPVCHKPLTIGVENRVEQLTNQTIDENNNRKKFYKMLPLHEVIALAKASTLASKKTWLVYNSLIEKFGNEFNILLDVSENDLLKALPKDEKLVGLILENREGKIKVKPGFDGEYGVPMLEEVQKKLI